MEGKSKFYVAVSRQFGSGGAETASKLAAKLGVPCYDKSIAEMTAVVTGFDKDIIHGSEDKAANAFWYGGFLSGESLSLYDKIYIGQSRVIKELAKRGSCVLVGRCAAKVLEDEAELIRVFICAPMAQRIERVSKGYEVSPAEAEKIIRRNDKARAAYYRKYADTEWGKIDNYDLVVNTRVGTDNAAKVVADYIKEIIG
jgi:cytidylate kinase